jgi:membrane protein DedA with SNARE-associated domain
MAKMPWKTFLFYDLTASAVCGTAYILIGYFFGKQWKLLEAYLVPTVPYLILVGIALVVCGVIFRHFISRMLAPYFSRKGH